MSLSRHIAEIERQARLTLKTRSQTVLPEVAQIPRWAEDVRGVPNATLRSSLFGAIAKGRRPYVERREIHAQAGISIRYTGAQLDQGDLDCWQAALHISRVQGLGAECRVTAYRLLLLLGRTDTGKNRQILAKHLSRLSATALEVKVEGHSYEGSLIDDVYRDESTREYIIRLNPKLRVLFQDGLFTQVDWDVRRALSGKPLAQWLHGYYASHASAFPIKVETLHRFCGSAAVRLSDFRKDLRRGLIALADARRLHGGDFNFEFRDDLVHVRYTPSASQRRHLSQKRELKIPSQHPASTVPPPPQCRPDTPGSTFQRPS